MLILAKELKNKQNLYIMNVQFPSNFFAAPLCEHHLQSYGYSAEWHATSGSSPSGIAPELTECLSLSNYSKQQYDACAVIQISPSKNCMQV